MKYQAAVRMWPQVWMGLALLVVSFATGHAQDHPREEQPRGYSIPLIDISADKS